MSYNFLTKRRSESGTALVLVTICILAIFGFAALSLDVGNVFREQRKENTATDAAALSAVILLTNTPQNAGSVIGFAEAMANANGVTTAEIGASNTGTIEVGIWNNGQFLANQTINGSYTAVRVPSKRSVPLSFAKIVGLSGMTPAVHSVAALTAAGSMANLVPFAVALELFATNSYTGLPSGYGDYLDLNDANIGSGKQGKLNFGFKNGDWNNYMTTNGWDGNVSVGSVPVITGNAQVKQAFQALDLNAVFAMAVVDHIDTSGNKDSNVVGFIIVKLVDFSGTGSGWNAKVQFLARVVGTGGGGTCPPPCAQARALME